jgi:RNA polymerase sigma-70 factor, ECF subfamily
MGDHDAEDRLAALVREHQGAVVAYARRRLGDWQAAEDLAAEVFVVAWRRQHDVPQQPRPWLYGVARRLLLNEFRRRARRDATERALLKPPPSVDDPAVRVTETDRVVRALRGLRESDRELLMLIGWEGLTVGEAATVLAAVPAVVSVRLYRARQRLARLLAEFENVEGAHSPADVRRVRSA